MASIQFYKGDQYLLDHCTKYLARNVADFRHTYSPDGLRRPTDNIAEAWRFPIVDTYAGGSPAVVNSEDFPDYNEVSFIYAGPDPSSPSAVGVIGTFAGLYESIPMKQVRFQGEPTRYWSITVVVPKGQSHHYRFLVDGKFVNDPINPQAVTLDNGKVWSRFFTESFTEPLVLERWELQLLYRLASTIAPFRSKDAEVWLQRYYFAQDQQTRQDRYSNAYRLDASVGEVNFIDNILAREERHRLIDYKICMSQIDQVLRARNPFVEPVSMTDEIFQELYDQMAADAVPGWDLSKYGSPRYFLYLLRRHAVTGALSHPKYGGNSGAAGWAYLGERYQRPAGDGGGSLFDWQRAIEKPLGTNSDYHG
jgi:hypothetical protein